MNSKSQQLKQLAFLRVAVGFIGEKATPRWWASSFCGTNGEAFLGPVFQRTFTHAQYQGVVAAAALVHDDRIGVGSVFHLFRLPEDMEQELHMISKDKIGVSFAEIIKDVESAKQFLRDYGSGIKKVSQGPVRIGKLSALRTPSVWKDVATFYINVFEHNREIFPFFSDRS